MVSMPRPFHALVVDDDHGVRATVRDVLEAAGHRPLCAGSRDEALEVVRLEPIHFSIVDVHVRADDGIIIFDTIRRILGSLPVIFMSGDFTPDLVARARAHGARRCLEKPLDLQLLREAVQHLVRTELLDDAEDH